MPRVFDKRAAVKQDAEAGHSSNAVRLSNSTLRKHEVRPFLLPTMQGMGQMSDDPTPDKVKDRAFEFITTQLGDDFHREPTVDAVVRLATAPGNENPTWRDKPAFQRELAALVAAMLADYP